MSHEDRFSITLDPTLLAPEEPPAPLDAATELVALRSRVAELEAEQLRLSEQLVSSERRKLDLAALYVASQRLHERLDRGHVLEVIREILVNLVGTEEFAVFELARGGRSLRLLDSMGVTPPTSPLPAGSCAISRAVAAGQPSEVASGASGCWPGAPAPTICVPLVVEGQGIGVIVVFGLLQQKPGLEPVDRELLDLLRVHAATALHVTALPSGEEAA